MSGFNDFRFVVMADARGEDEGKNEKIVRKIMEQIIKLYPQPNYVFFLGDLILESKKLSRVNDRFEYFKATIGEYFPIENFLPTVGNHDVGDNPKDNSKEKVFAKVFSDFKADGFLEGYYRTSYFVDCYNTRMIVLNSFHKGESSQISGKQLSWLEKITSVPKQHKIVFLHAPAYPTGHHLDSSLDIFPEKRDCFWSVVDRNNIDLVFSGHEHNYSRRVLDKFFSSPNILFSSSVTQVITGGAGGPLMGTFKDSRGVVVPPVPIHHYVVVDVFRENLSVMAVSINGDVIDKFNL